MITSRTARGPLERAGVERILGDAPDVSEWNNLEMNDLSWLEKPTSIAERSVGRRRESTFMASDRHSTPSGQQLLCYWVLPGTTGVPILIVGTTLRQVTELDLQTVAIKERVKSVLTASFENGVREDNRITTNTDDAEEVSVRRQR